MIISVFWIHTHSVYPEIGQPVKFEPVRANCDCGNGYIGLRITTHSTKPSNRTPSLVFLQQYLLYDWEDYLSAKPEYLLLCTCIKECSFVNLGYLCYFKMTRCCLPGSLLRWKWVHVGTMFNLFADVVGPGKFVTIKPIPVEKLREYCEINHADANKSFRDEFVVSSFVILTTLSSLIVVVWRIPSEQYWYALLSN